MKNHARRRPRIAPLVEVSKSRFSEKLSSDAILVGLATAVAYLVTYGFESGYCRIFEIPTYLIEPSLGNVLFAATVLILVALQLTQVGDLLGRLTDSIPSVRFKVILVLVAFIWIATMVLTPLRWVNVFLAVMVTLHLLMNYLGELIAGKGTFVDRIKAADIKDAKEITFSQRLKSMPSRLVYSGIVFTMFAYMLAYLIGALVAKSQTAFYVLSDEPTVAVVKQYGSKAVGIRYQGSPPRLTGEYVLLQEAGPNGLRIKLLELGAIAPRRTP